MEEMFYCTTFSYQLQGMVGWMIDKAFSYRAEKGRLKDAFPVLGTIAASMTENPQWVAARRQVMSRMVASATRPPQTSTGRLSILDVSRNMSKDQESFLKGLDSSSAPASTAPAWTPGARPTAAPPPSSPPPPAPSPWTTATSATSRTTWAASTAATT